MAYKDKDKQREAVKQATRRYRVRLKGITGISRNKGITDKVSQGIDMAVDADEVYVDAIEDGVLVEPEGYEIESQSHNPMMVGYVPPQD